nr:Hsp20/alpha crystallin family protein [Brevundimonas aurantiaca]
MSTDITQATEKTPTDTPETIGGGRVYRPLTDIVETDQGVSMMLEMPGVGSDDVEITLENRVLTIRGKVEPMRPENLELAYAEYSEGDFERASRFPRISTPTGSRPRCAEASSL